MLDHSRVSKSHGSNKAAKGGWRCRNGILALSAIQAPTLLSVTASTFALIALAEIGDKSQLVCMALAARHRGWPVFFGAALAFLVLNVLAVAFGTGIGALVPDRVLSAVVAVLFAVFGVMALLNQEEEDSEDVEERPGHGIFFTTLLLIFVAEFGDKTQLAVAALASEFRPVPVWLGATVGLIAVSAAGVWAGRTVLQRLPITWLHRFSGVLFLGFAAFAAWEAVG